MEQLQQDFSDSTKRAGSDRTKNRQKVRRVHDKKYPIVKLAPKVSDRSFRPFENQYKYRPI